jgi:hypothetical protein
MTPLLFCCTLLTSSNSAIVRAQKAQTVSPWMCTVLIADIKEMRASFHISSSCSYSHDTDVNLFLDIA